jgi:hypothetical protein
MKNLYLFVFFIFVLSLNAQPSFDAKRDFTWVMGSVYWTYDSTDLIHLNFNTDSLELQYKQTKNVGQGLYQTNASICDTSGNLLFFSNGCVLVDSSSNFIDGADTINKGPRWSYHCNTPNAGYVIVNGCWILPVAENKFKVFYTDQINGYGHTSGIRFATVTRDANSGYLQGYNPDTYLFQGDLTSQKRGFVRHGNGRDWWMINEAYDSHTYYISIIDSSENINNTEQSIFSEFPPKIYHGGGQGCFSSNGGLYATIDARNQCQIFDFDRCEGKLSNPLVIPLPLPYDSIGASTGIAISPNSRFLYLMTLLNIWQYDLTSPDIASSKIRVAQNDGWTYGAVNFHLVFYQSQLGPDGKIYVFPPAGRSAFSVIDQPDSLGLACKVLQHRYFFPDWGNVSQPPRFPNFRLGPIVGSPCDTLTVSTKMPELTGKFILRPNPATTYSVADITVADYSEAMHLEVCALDGKLLGRYQVPPYASLQRIDTSLLPNGMYLVSLCSRGRVLKTEKLVVLRDER